MTKEASRSKRKSLLKPRTLEMSEGAEGLRSGPSAYPLHSNLGSILEPPQNSSYFGSLLKNFTYSRQVRDH